VTMSTSSEKTFASGVTISSFIVAAMLIHISRVMFHSDRRQHTG
jgi:hypothetical protein